VECSMEEIIPRLEAISQSDLKHIAGLIGKYGREMDD
jgi:hypothetical protein